MARAETAGFLACRFCHFRAILVEGLVFFVVWYIIYGVTIGKEKQVQEWNIYQLDRQPINGAFQLEEYKYAGISSSRDIPPELREDEGTAEEIVVPSGISDDDLKLQFWTKALPVIVEAFGGNSTYSNVSSLTRGTWEGFVGIGGVNLYCTMRLKKHTLSANIWIDVKDKEKNKKIFDVMYARKDNIEKEVLYSIGWNRGDDKRSSTVNVEIEDVDFNDWGN